MDMYGFVHFSLSITVGSQSWPYEKKGIGKEMKPFEEAGTGADSLEFWSLICMVMQLKSLRSSSVLFPICLVLDPHFWEAPLDLTV